MQPKITRLEWLKQTVLALDDDLTRPWSDYQTAVSHIVRNSTWKEPR